MSACLAVSTVETFQLFKARKYLEMIQKFKSMTNNEILRKLNRNSRNSGSAGTQPRKKCFVKRNNYGAVNHQIILIIFHEWIFHKQHVEQTEENVLWGDDKANSSEDQSQTRRKRCMRALKKLIHLQFSDANFAVSSPLNISHVVSSLIPTPRVIHTKMKKRRTGVLVLVSYID